MERNLTSAPINRELSPLCPRDNHKMTFQSDGVVWEQADTKEKLSGCHCGFMGCSVGYAPEHGYFTIVNAPDLIAGIHRRAGSQRTAVPGPRRMVVPPSPTSFRDVRMVPWHRRMRRLPFGCSRPLVEGVVVASPIAALNRNSDSQKCCRYKGPAVPALVLCICQFHKLRVQLLSFAIFSRGVERIHGRSII